MLLAFILQVQRQGVGRQFCKVVCRNAGWRGPICADSIDTLTGHLHTTCTVQELLLSFPDSLFNFPCTLLYLPPDLDVWHGHSLLSDISRERQYPVGTELLTRCKDHTDAIEGSNVITCVDGEWDHQMPWCSKTSGRINFDGEDAVKL